MSQRRASRPSVAFSRYDRPERRTFCYLEEKGYKPIHDLSQSGTLSRDAMRGFELQFSLPWRRRRVESRLKSCLPLIQGCCQRLDCTVFSILSQPLLARCICHNRPTLTMKDSRSLVLLALAATANAQSAPGFPVQVSENLRVDFQSSSTSISPAGVLVDRDSESKLLPPQS